MIFRLSRAAVDSFSNQPQPIRLATRAYTRYPARTEQPWTLPKPVVAIEPALNTIATISTAAGETDDAVLDAGGGILTFDKIIYQLEHLWTPLQEFHFVSDDEKFVISKVFLGVFLVHRNQRLDYLPRIMVNDR